jgi:O-antigen ligase
MINNELRARLNYLIISLIAFTIPLSLRITTFFFILLGFLYLTELNFYNKFKLLYQQKLLLLFVLFYFCVIVSYFMFENGSIVYSDLEVKISFLFLPILFGTSISIKKIVKIENKTILNSFILGLIIVTFFNLSLAGYKFYLTEQVNYLFYTNFTSLLHPSYFALFLNTGILILLKKCYDLKQQHKRFSKEIALIFLFSFATVLTGSKAGTIFLFVLFIFFILIELLVSKKIVFTFYALILLFFGGLILQKNLTLKNRFVEMYFSVFENKNSSESSSNVRLSIWKISINKIAERPFFGYGSGNVRIVLSDEYKNQHMNHSFQNKLNAHNQYLQTTLSFGLVGGFILILLLIVQLIYSYTMRDWVYFSFIMLVSFNWFFESMLERQAGVIFFTFFSLLFYSSLDNNRKI